MLTITRGCMRTLMSIGWVCHALGLTLLSVALASDNWLVRPTTGETKGVLPCCFSFVCDRQTRTTKTGTIDIFYGLLFSGLVLVLTGLVISVVHGVGTWRHDKREWMQMLYVAVAFIFAGAIVLFTASIVFVVKIPSETQEMLMVRCGTHFKIEVGYSFTVYIIGMILFLVSAVFLLLGGPRRRRPVMQIDFVEIPMQNMGGQRMNNERQTVAQSTSSTNTMMAIGGDCLSQAVPTAPSQPVLPPAYAEVVADLPPPYAEIE